MIGVGHVTSASRAAQRLDAGVGQGECIGERRIRHPRRGLGQSVVSITAVRLKRE
jgi:hypothetical protein